MEKEIRDQFRICKSSKEVWEHIKLLYEQKSNQRLDLLYCELFGYTTDSVIIHVTKMQTLWQDIKDELAILDTLTNEEYVRFNNTWDAMPAKEQTVSKLTELLRLLEVRIEQHTVVSVN